jgi:magnesium-transporting ATPase (P-type)
MMGTETEFFKNFENIKTCRRTPNQLLITKFIRFLVVFLFLMI